jgi:hypothetical protein
MKVTDETEQDLRRILKQDFKQSLPNIPMYDLLPVWLQFKARCIEPIPRSVSSSLNVIAKRSQFLSIIKIENLLRDGGDLKPYLSKKIWNEPERPKPDRLFLDWGIHHLHLGGFYESPRNIRRTKPVLFVYISGAEAVLLDVKDHGSSNPLVWVDVDLIRSLGTARPDLLSRREVKGIVGISPIRSENERAELRAKDANTIIEVDGKYYSGLGGFISAAGTGVKFRRLTDQLNVTISELVSNFTENRIHAQFKTAIYAKLGHPIRLGIKHLPGHLVVYEKERNLELFRSWMIC